MACKISGAEEIVLSALPTIFGRRAAASAKAMAAWREAVLAMMLTWFSPSYLMAAVTWRRRFTTFSSICLIMRGSRRWTLRM